MSTILVGVDASERSEDAIAFALELARASNAHVVVASAFPYEDGLSRAANLDYRRALEVDALHTARRLAVPLSELEDGRVEIRAVARTSPPHALQDLAEELDAALLVVGSSHTSRRGRILPGSTAERLLHGAPCPVVVVPQGFRDREHGLKRIGVADDGSAESRAALRAGSAVAQAVGGELSIIRVAPDVMTVAPAPDAISATMTVQEDLRRTAQRELDHSVELVATELTARPVLLEGDPPDVLAKASEQLDLLVTGSRGYGPLRSVVLGGVTGPLLRGAHAPVLVVPRGVDTPLVDLLGLHAEAST